MNDPNRSPKVALKHSESKNPFQNYKLIFSILKSSNRPTSSDKDMKLQFRPSNPNPNPNLKITKCEPFPPATKTSRQRHLLSSHKQHKNQHSLSNSITLASPSREKRADLKIDLKKFNQKDIDYVKTEETVVQNKALFHSERKLQPSTPETLRFTSRCMEIEDIIMTAPYCHEKVSKGSKIIKLKRPDK